jgi:hypothetical protein
MIECKAFDKQYVSRKKTRFENVKPATAFASLGSKLV